MSCFSYVALPKLPISGFLPGGVRGLHDLVSVQRDLRADRRVLQRRGTGALCRLNNGEAIVEAAAMIVATMMISTLRPLLRHRFRMALCTMNMTLLMQNTNIGMVCICP